MLRKTETLTDEQIFNTVKDLIDLFEKYRVEDYQKALYCESCKSIAVIYSLESSVSGFTIYASICKHCNTEDYNNMKRKYSLMKSMDVMMEEKHIEAAKN